MVSLFYNRRRTDRVNRMANSGGGAFLPNEVTINGMIPGSAFGGAGVVVKTAVMQINGTALHGATSGIQAWQNPEAVAIIIQRCLLDVTTVATGACTIDVGYTATSAATTSDTLLDGIDANAAIILADSMNAALDSGANALAQKAAIGKWVTIDEKTGDATGMVATLYIQYILTVAA